MVTHRKLLTILSTAVLLLSTSVSPAFAVTSSRSTGTTTSVGRATTVTRSTTVSRSSTASRAATTGRTSFTSRPIISRDGVNTVSRTTTRPNPVKSAQSGRSVTAQRAIQRASKSSTYRSLSNSRQRQSYLNWHGNYSGHHYYHHYFTSIRYWYIPGNIWNRVIIQHNTQDKLATRMKEVAAQRGYKWIKVNDKMIAVPERIYNKVKVGDKIKLIDANHIKINGHMYR